MRHRQGLRAAVGGNMIPVGIRPHNGEFWPVVYAKDQPEYLPLPAIRNDTGIVITRWKLSWRERLRAVWSGDLYLTILTFNRPLQPIKLDTLPPS